MHVDIYVCVYTSGLKILEFYTSVIFQVENTLKFQLAPSVCV